MKYLFVLILIIAAITACENKAEVKAKIFERRVIEKNRLLLKFEYHVDKIRYVDSAIVKNVIVNVDTIDVLLNESEPGRAIPDLDGFQSGR